eukprot:759505-Amphidinium_carterae.2
MQHHSNLAPHERKTDQRPKLERNVRQYVVNNERHHLMRVCCHLAFERAHAHALSRQRLDRSYVASSLSVFWWNAVNWSVHGRGGILLGGPYRSNQSSATMAH